MFSPLIFGRFLRRLSGDPVAAGVAGVGAVRDDVSRAVLGNDQHGAEVLRVYGQALYPVLPEAADAFQQESLKSKAIGFQRKPMAF